MLQELQEQRATLLEATVSYIRFQNTENGWTVAVVETEAGTLTAVGNLLGARVDDRLQLFGQYMVDPKWGEQFKVEGYTLKVPASLEGIRHYLASGLISGIGPKTADAILDAFGEETLHVLDEAPARLREVPGIGEVKAARINEAWQAQRVIQDIMLFLHHHSVSTKLALRLYEAYGEETVAVVKANPYQLTQVYGVGFATADKIARSVGIAQDAPQRIAAALGYVLGEAVRGGHMGLPEAELLAETRKLLDEVPEAVCRAELRTQIEAGHLILHQELLFLPRLHRAEQRVADGVRRLSTTLTFRTHMLQQLHLAREILALGLPFRLSDQQQEAVRVALSSPVSIITGGPGTGKSTIMRALVGVLMGQDFSYELAAPTGRAAKRLSETSYLADARTLHRLLEWSFAEGGFVRNAEHPLETDFIIVDEASMIDAPLMASLLAAISSGTHLVLVGDADQLPSVGPGNVLRDLIASHVVPTVRLDAIYRQAEGSQIVANAHRINQGRLPELGGGRDFHLMEQNDPAATVEDIVYLVSESLPDYYGCTPDDIQVLTPQRRGILGYRALNQRLQAVLNPARPGKAEYERFGTTYRRGDRVMQTRNDYDKDVYNGDMGVIRSIDLDAEKVEVLFDGVSVVTYQLRELDDLIHAYAISVHKSQGSEYPVVLMPVSYQHYYMLQRPLIYTAITRAQQGVVLVGTKKAVAHAVRTNKPILRHTRLVERLQGGSGRRE